MLATIQDYSAECQKSTTRNIQFMSTLISQTQPLSIPCQHTGHIHICSTSESLVTFLLMSSTPKNLTCEVKTAALHNLVFHQRLLIKKY